MGALLLLSFYVSVISASGQSSGNEIKLENRFAVLISDKKARILHVYDKASKEDYLKRSGPFAYIRSSKGYFYSDSLKVLSDAWFLTFKGSKAKVVLRVSTLPTYFRFEIIEAVGSDIKELAFLSLPVKSSKYVSRTSGTAADDRFAFCLRTLTLKTRVSVGGRPTLLRAVNEEKYGFRGGKAALVACPTGELREVLKELLTKEKVLSSVLGGPWALDAEENHGSYLFAVASEKNIESWIKLAKLCGATHLHLIGWWRSLGHYEPRPDLFPNGLPGLKGVVKKIHSAGLKAGLHTLTGCISPNDPWVTPTPDPRLAADAYYILAEDIDPQSKAIITLEKPGRHDTVWTYASSGNVLQIGRELIQYDRISFEPPYGFFNCKRGAFGTKASAHKKGDWIKHLQHRYFAFYPDQNSTLVNEIADRIAYVFNYCGFDMIYICLLYTSPSPRD